MPQNTYEGPRHGDYVRYVDELLRTSPLYRSAAQGWMAQGRSDFTDAVATPGAQAQSVVERVREQVQAAAVKARAAAEQASLPSPPGRAAPARAPKTAKAAKTVKTMKTAKKTGFRLGPGQWLGIVVGLFLSVLIPGVGPFILLLTIINAIFKGFRAGLRSSR